MEKANSSRVARLAQVFSEDCVPVTSDLSLRDSFDKLKKLLINETETWWDHNTLLKYVDKKRTNA